MTDTEMKFSLRDVPLETPKKQEPERKVSGQMKVELKGKKVYVAIPCHDFKLHLDTVMGLMELKEQMMRYGVIGQFQTLGGSALIDKARSDLVGHFLRETDADYFFFLDSDIGFRGEDVIRLMAWMEDPSIDMVSAAYPAKVEVGPAGKFFINADFNDEGFPVVDKRGLLRVNAMGLGFCMVRRSVLEDMAAKYKDHWFYAERPGSNEEVKLINFFIPFVDGSHHYWGEDTAFFIRAASAGHSNLYVDLNVALKHVGRKVYTGDVAKALTDSVIDIQRGGGDRNNPFGDAVKEIKNATA